MAKTQASSRDNFPPDVIETLGKQAGFQCSNPNCPAPTVGPSPINPDKYIYSGVAAHITAAAKKGPRYDENLTPEQRGSADNGIHLCARCATIIDKNNGADFTTETLRNWKLQHLATISTQHGTGPLLWGGNVKNVDFTYQDDFFQLRYQTRRSLETLSQHHQINTVNGLLTIERAVEDAFFRHIQNRPLILVGEPGAGKSGVLYETARRLNGNGEDVVAFTVEEYAEFSRYELQNELGLNHDLLDVIKNWPGERPAYLFIDALDAAREENTAQTLRSFITEVLKFPRWRVAVSIRKYDLRYSDDLKRLFRGTPIEAFHDSEFRSVAHINVPKLTSKELEQIAKQEPDLERLLSQGGDSIRELLTNLFNVRLANELIIDGVEISELTPIQTQNQLLDRYWKRRVLREDNLTEARRILINRAVSEMVQQRRTDVDRDKVTNNDLSASAPLRDLLHNHILVESQPYPSSAPNQTLFAFSHHIIYDYAVSRLLRGDVSKLVDYLSSDSQFALALRRSLELHYDYIWELDPDNHVTFWKTIIGVSAATDVPVIAKIVGSSVAVDRIQKAGDYQWLTEIFTGQNRETDEWRGSKLTIEYLCRAVIARNSWESGGNKAPWASFVNTITPAMIPFAPDIVDAVYPLIRELCRLFTTLPIGEQLAIGEAARHLLRAVWAQSPPSEHFAAHTIELVAQTFESDVEASTKLLQAVIEPERLANYGYFQLRRLTEHSGNIARFAPNFVVEVYAASFGFEEDKQDATLMHPSLILPLGSNRRQDYKMALFSLKEKFSLFLDVAPVEATRCLIRVMEIYAAKRGLTMGDRPEPPRESFDWNGEAAYVQSDGSCVFMQGLAAHHEDALQILSKWADYVERCCVDTSKFEVTPQILNVLIKENKQASIWASLLKSALTNPDALGLQILPLLKASAILWGLDTRYPAGELLKVLFARLNTKDKQDVEEAILRIPDYLPPDMKENGLRHRNNLLSLLEPYAAVTDEAGAIIAMLSKDKNNSYVNEPPFAMTEWMSSESTVTDWLKEQGVATSQDSIRPLVLLIETAQTFAHSNQNTQPLNNDAVSVILTTIRSLFEEIKQPDFLSQSITIQKYAWGALAAACAKVAQCNNPELGNDGRELLKSALLAASLYPDPPKRSADEQMATINSWGFPSARIDAAVGIILLCRQDSIVDQELLDCVTRLANDTVPTVRYQIVCYLNTLYYTANEDMWAIIDEKCLVEENSSVLQSLIHIMYKILNAESAARLLTDLEALLARLTPEKNNESLRHECAKLLSYIYVYFDEGSSKNSVYEYFNNPESYHSEIEAILGFLRSTLMLGSVEEDNQSKAEIRHRGVEIFRCVLQCAIQRLDAICKRNMPTAYADWPEVEQERWQNTQTVIVELAQELYFASGAFDAMHPPDSDKASLASDIPERIRFLEELEATLEALATLDNPRTGYYLMETLEHYIEINPRNVLRLLATSILSTAAKGLQFESLAASLYVRIVERYLANYRNVLFEPEYEKLLVSTLDVFVAAGWPDAMRLAYRMDEINR